MRNFLHALSNNLQCNNITVRILSAAGAVKDWTSFCLYFCSTCESRNIGNTSLCYSALWPKLTLPIPSSSLYFFIFSQKLGNWYIYFYEILFTDVSVKEGLLNLTSFSTSLEFSGLVNAGVAMVRLFCTEVCWLIHRSLIMASQKYYS